MKNTYEDQLITDIAQFVWNPLSYVLYAFPWGEHGSPLQHSTGPRAWQVDGLSRIALHLSNPATRYEPLMLSRASGHGIGKSAFIGMVCKWALDTCVGTRIVITANTEGQLRTKTSPEVQKWCKMSITEHWFEYERTSIYAKGDMALSWRADFTPWSKHNSEAFAGLHNERKRIVLIMDEASAIDDAIWEVAEGALTDENTEIIWIAFGNPTRNIGRFRECFRKHSKYWDHAHIDSRTVEGTNKKLFARWKEQYGEDSDFFRVRVRGQFPASSSYQFYSTTIVENARRVVLKPEQFKFAPVIIGVDPSWTGDDEFVISKRQGLDFRVLATFPKNDNDIRMANIIARYEDEFNADAVFIDGGYGTGIVSAGQTMNRHWQLVWFNEASSRLDCVNKRAEMHVLVKEWLQQGGSIDEKDQELFEELIAQETLPTLDGKYKFIPKEDMKEVLGRSPNRLDSLALTFAHPVQPRLDRSNLAAVYDHITRNESGDYDPLDTGD